MLQESELIREEWVDCHVTVRFEGEDMLTEARMKVQREQQRAWLEQQMLERCRADEERKQAEKAYHDAVVARDCRAQQLDLLERDCRRRLEQATCRFNLALVLLFLVLFY